MTDTERLDFLEKSSGLNLVNDDAGRWAVSDSGMQPVPPDGGFKDLVDITCLVDPEYWKPTIREAIDFYVSQQGESDGTD